MDATSPSFKICGVSIPLRNNEPESIKIMHAIPKGYTELAVQRSIESKCDVTVILGEKIIRAHKAVLVERIPFFRALFASNMKESKDGEVKLSLELCAFDITTVETLLNYAYTGRLTISVANFQSLLMGALYFNMELVIDECGRFIRRRLMVENALSILTFCRSIAYRKIDDFILTFIDKNFVCISQTPEYLELSFDDLGSILCRDSINIDNERQVFFAISSWIKHGSDRKIHASRLLKYVRCTRHGESFINEMAKRKWVSDDPICMELVNEAKDKAKQPNSLKKTERVCDDAHQLIFTIGFTKGSKFNNMQVYDPISDAWTAYEIPLIRAGHGVAVVDDKIFFPGNTRYKTVLNTKTNTLNEMPTMTTKRTHMTIGVINRQIYVAGGFNYPNYLASAEKYNPSTNEWSSLPPMSKAVANPSSCVLDGKFYVLGGESVNATRLASCQYYSPETGNWHSIRPMHFVRTVAAAAALDGYIYVAGGYDYSGMSVMERYDPATDTWIVLSSMKHKRFCHDLKASCGKLFAIGGYETIGAKTLTSIEMYDPESDSWEERAPLIERAKFVYAGSFRIPSSFPSPVANLEHKFHPSHSNGFSSFCLNEELLKGLTECGIKHPSKVQHELIPQALRGMDINCQAPSGHGKTTLYIVASLQQLEPIERNVSTLILCHTREKATQISDMYAKISAHMPEVEVAVFSGDARTKKNRGVLMNKCPNIVIGTPGRILALVKSGALKLSELKVLVLDECDRMLKDQDAHVAVQKIFKFTPQSKQVMMFSASLPTEMRTVCNKFIKNVENDAEKKQRDFRNHSIEEKKKLALA